MSGCLLCWIVSLLGQAAAFLWFLNVKILFSLKVFIGKQWAGGVVWRLCCCFGFPGNASKWDSLWEVVGIFVKTELSLGQFDRGDEHHTGEVSCVPVGNTSLYSWCSLWYGIFHSKTPQGECGKWSIVVGWLSLLALGPIALKLVLHWVGSGSAIGCHATALYPRWVRGEAAGECTTMFCVGPHSS